MILMQRHDVTRFLMQRHDVTPKANVHGAVADFVEHHFGRDLIRQSGTAAVVEEVMK